MTKLIQHHESLKETVSLALGEAESFSALAQDVLNRVVIETIKRYQQKLNVGIQDSVADLLDTFKQNVSQAVFDAATGWRVTNRDAFLFPQGCRFCFSSAENTIVVIEQAPQLRALSFDKRIIGDSYHSVDNYGTMWASMSLPYVVFVLHFKQTTFCNLFCGWRTSPLSSLEDDLMRPVLPNIRDNLSVCTGNFPIAATTISQISEAVISQFWCSTFNNDISDHWWKKQIIDSRLKFLTWRSTSISDPMFVLNIRFPSAARSVKSVINLLTKHDVEPNESAMRHQLSDTIDKSTELFFAKIMSYIRSTKFEKYHPKDVSESLRDILKDASSEFVDILFSIREELESLRKDIKGQNEMLIEPSGRLWSNYCS